MKKQEILENNQAAGKVNVSEGSSSSKSNEGDSLQDDKNEDLEKAVTGREKAPTGLPFEGYWFEGFDRD